ncbi:MAG: FmdB family zinc ribbon protein [Terriglobia bacterium]
MPIFEYQCRDCGAKFERFVASREKSVVCGDCGGPHVEQQLSVFAVSAPSGASSKAESGPCPCGAPRRGMCGE